MDRLKRILKQAFAKNAQRIRLSEGAFAELELGGMTESLSQEVQIDADFLTLLQKALLPKDLDKILQGSPVQGQLTILEKGRIQLLYQSKPISSLSLYIPPGGDSLFSQDWLKATAPAPAPAPAPEPVSVAPPPAQMSVAPAPPPAQMSVAPAPPPAQMSVAPAPPPAMNIFEAPPTVEVASSAQDFKPAPSMPINAPANIGFIPPEVSAPLEMPSVPEPPIAPILVQLMPRFEIEPEPIASIALIEPIASIPLIEPIASIPPILAPQQVPAQALHWSPSAPLPAAPQPAVTQPAVTQPAVTQPAVTQPAVTHSAATVLEDPLPTIYFGADIPGATVQAIKGGAPIDKLLHEMVRLKASDLHLTMGQRISYRIDGEIVRNSEGNLNPEQMESYILPIIPSINRREFAKINDTDFSYAVEGLARFRVNVFRDRFGVGAVLRQIPATVLSADQLNLPPVVRNLCDFHKGLIVVTGPTGSGKSTTLAAMIDIINSNRSDHILTIEDPIEFIHAQKKCLVNQREIRKHTDTFSRALRAALREDPDIVLIGEMRDLETVSIAIETAETGHLVFGTLHTNTAISTVDRIIDQFPQASQSQVRIMLAESLRGVVAQTLCKKKGGGRVAALEVLVVNHAVSALIREGKTFMISNVMQTQRAEGNVTLNESLLNLVVKGTIEPKEAWAKAIDKDGLAKSMQAKNISIEFITQMKSHAA